jgi:MFS family permease
MVAELQPTKPHNVYNPNNVYQQIDESKISKSHWITVFMAGMGFFTDAYDLFIIGTVTILLTPIWNLSTNEISFLNSASLLASALGALLFGKLIDRLGRKSIYGFEATCLTLGALLSAFSWNFTSLLIFRILVGFGVGGDYATSSVITSEYSNRSARGKLIGTVFAMQGFGLIAGPLVAASLLSFGVSHILAWRIMLGLGAIPAASVIYLRRRIHETPRYSLNVTGDMKKAVEAANWATGSVMAVDSIVESTIKTTKSRFKLSDRKFLLRLVGTGGAWFLMDIAFYGNSISSPILLKALRPHSTLLTNILLAAGIFTLFAVPGYWIAVRLIDKIGRKYIQLQGFTVMTLAFGAIAIIPNLTKNPSAFLLLFGISYFFIEFGPNMTTFIYPSEIFPTSLRGTGEGISAGLGKLGAFIGALMIPHLIKSIHLNGVMGTMAVISGLGFILTLILLPEPKNKSLEEASTEL